MPQTSDVTIKFYLFEGPREWLEEKRLTIVDQQQTICSLRQISDAQDDVVDYLRIQNARLEAKCRVMWWALTVLFFMVVTLGGFYLGGN